MKRFKILATAVAAVYLSFSFSACNSGEETKKADMPVDTVAQKMDVAPIAKPSDILIIMHKVANFAKWRPVFEANDSMQKTFGLHNYVLARGAKDSNMVMVVIKIDDVAKAKEFTQSADLKTKMKAAGVMGAPVFSYVNIQMVDTSANLQTARLMFTHKVKDWDAWKKEFDSHKQVRLDAGLSDRAVGYSIDDNHMVTVVCSVNDMKKAEAFVGSKELKEKMAAAGVEGAPTLFYYNVVQRY